MSKPQFEAGHSPGGSILEKNGHFSQWDQLAHFNVLCSKSSRDLCSMSSLSVFVTSFLLAFTEKWTTTQKAPLKCIKSPHRQL